MRRLERVLFAGLLATALTFASTSRRVGGGHDQDWSVRTVHRRRRCNRCCRTRICRSRYQGKERRRGYSRKAGRSRLRRRCREAGRSRECCKAPDRPRQCRDLDRQHQQSGQPSRSQIAAQSQTAQIVVAGTAQKITTMGNKWVFRSPVPDNKVAGDLAGFIQREFPNVKKVAFLYVNDDFGRGGFEKFKEGAAKYGIEIVAEERYARGDLDFTAQLGRIKASPAQALIEWSRYSEGALVAKQFVQMNMKMPRFGCDGVALPKYVELGGDAVNGVFYMNSLQQRDHREYSRRAELGREDQELLRQGGGRLSFRSL